MKKYLILLIIPLGIIVWYLFPKVREKVSQTTQNMGDSGVTGTNTNTNNIGRNTNTPPKYNPSRGPLGGLQDDLTQDEIDTLASGGTIEIDTDGDGIADASYGHRGSLGGDGTNTGRG